MSVFVNIMVIFPGIWRIQQCIFCVCSTGVVKRKKDTCPLHTSPLRQEPALRAGSLRLDLAEALAYGPFSFFV